MMTNPNAQRLTPNAQLPNPMQLTFQHNDDLITLNAEPDGDGWLIRLPDGTEHHVTARRLPDDVLQIGNREQGTGNRVTPSPLHPFTPSHFFRVPVARTERGVELSYGGQTFVFEVATGRQVGVRRKSASGVLVAPMVGVVADVLVTEGQSVEAYQPLVVVEAMKVMATIEAPFAGTVKAVHVQKSQRVARGETVVEVVPE